jgi:hypothetical protein
MTRTKKHRLEDAPQATADLLSSRATLTVSQAASVLGIGRGTAYEQARRYVASRGAYGIPAIRIGGRLVVPTFALRAFLGMEGHTGNPAVAVGALPGRFALGSTTRSVQKPRRP